MPLAPEVELLIPAIELLPVSVMITDLSGIVRWANACFVHLAERTLDDIIGRNVQTLSSEPGPFQCDAMLHVAESGAPWKDETVLDLPNGEHYCRQQTITPNPGLVRHYDSLDVDIGQAPQYNPRKPVPF